MAKIHKPIQIEVSNFGPISKGKVCTKPLTIFTGPSNTGKTYLAKLLYSILKTSTDHIDPSNISRGDKDPSNLPLKDILSFNGSFIKEDKLQKYLITNTIKDLSTDQSLFDRIVKECLDHQQIKDFLIKYFLIYTRRFNKQIELYLSPPFKLVKVGQSNLNILLNDMMPFDQKDDHQQTCLHIIREPFEKFIEPCIKEICNGICTYLFPKMSNDQNLDKEVFFKKMNQNISDFCRDYGKSHLHVVHFNIHYLPAARTGIMQTHRLIAASAIKSLANTNKTSKLINGENADLLEHLITIDTDKGTIAGLLEIVDNIETNVLEGQVEVVFDETNYPDFVFKQDNRSFNMQEVSSMVTEIAPIVLFLKHYVKAGDTLFIEEPEAGLHPKAQKDMAGILVALVKAGVNVIITTHSEILVEQISNYRMAEKIPEEKRKKIMKDEYNLILSEKELAVYNFKKKEQDVTVEEVPFDDEDGISIKDHNDVSTEIYDETIDIYDESRKDEPKSSA